MSVKQVERVLIVKMWALGDVLMATPLLRALKRAYPNCEITWFIEKTQASILENNPLIHDVIAFDSATWRRQFRYGQFASYLKTSFAMRRQLLARRFDVVINLTAEKWWSAWFTVAPIRIGLFPRTRAGWIGKMYTTAIERQQEPWLHNTQHYLLPAKALGINDPFDEQIVLGVSEQHREDVQHFLNAHTSFDPSRPVVVLHPGTSQASKCWLSEQYAALSRRLSGYNVVITGSGSERELAESISRTADSSPIVAAGQLSHIGQTAALIERASALVTGDTSALHMASALDTPLVGIYGSTRPKDNAPLFGKHELLFDDTVQCSPCYKNHCPWTGDEYMKCMKGVSVERVMDALGRLGITTKEQNEVEAAQI